MATTLADLIVSARLLVGDSSTSNLSRNEDLNNADIGNAIDGTRKVFSVLNYPITPGGTQTVIVDGVALAPTAYSVNEPLGEITLVTAPTVSMYVSYYFYLFDDTTWTEFVESAVQRLNLATNNGLTADVTQIANGLLSAVKQFAAGAWAMRIASQTGLWYNQRLQERVEDRETISKKFAALSAQYMKQGQADRDAFYSGAGASLKPSMRIVQHIPSPWTPGR